MIRYIREWRERSRFRQGHNPNWWKLLWYLLGSPFHWAAGALRWLFGGLAVWWKSRVWRRLIWGLPTIAVLTVVIYFSMQAAATTPATLAQQYLVAGRSASDRQAWPQAVLFLERAIELGVRDRSTLYALAVAADKLNDESRKVAVLEQLAPETHAVYAPAHLWKATRILSAPVVTREMGSEAERHLKFVLQLDQNNFNAHSILGDLYFQAGLWASAADHLRYARQDSFRYRLMLAKATAATGNITAGRGYAEDVYSRARAVVTESPRETSARLELGEAALLLERYPEAVRILEEGIKLDDLPVFRQSLALVLVHWSDAMLRESPENRDHAFQLLAAALEHNPNELLLFEKILKLLRDQDATATTAEMYLKSNIVQGRAVGISHLILGTSYFENGSVELAGTHLEQAFRLLPTGLIVANNFAWYLVKSETPDADQALKIIDAVVREDSVRPEFRETRGHVLLAKQDWKSAIADFEYALPRLPPSAETHRGLSKAYLGLGLQDLANEHSRLAGEIELSTRNRR